MSTESFVPRTERSYWEDIAAALNAAHAVGMPVGIDLDGTLTDHNTWSVVWDRTAERWTVAGYEDESTDVDPIQLRWGLNDVEWCDDDNVIVLLSGPDGEPYTLELEPSQAAILRDDLAGPEGSAAFRAAWDTEQVGPLYGREEVARAHCERDARLDYPDGTRLVWRAFRDDDAQLFAVEAGEERPTGYTVTRQPLASEVVEEGGE